MAFQNVFILGTGNVGKELRSQIYTHDGTGNGHHNPTRIIGVANSRDFVLRAGGIEESTSPTTQYGSYEHILESVRKAGLEGEIVFVDATANGSQMLAMHMAVIRDTANSIVTANKLPLAGPMDTFRLLTNDPSRYAYNTTVMAGATAVPYLQQAHGISEGLIGLSGTFSGTLAYVCSELEA